MSRVDMFLSLEGLAQLVARLATQDIQVIAPVQKETPGGPLVTYSPVTRSDQVAPHGAPMPRCSLREYFQPPTEVIFRWEQQQLPQTRPADTTASSIIVQPVTTSFIKRVLLFTRPCDAAALPVVDRVMGWDTSDGLWFGRREATTIITRACQGQDQDAHCFCTPMGLGPECSEGSDIMLYPMPNGYRVHCLTPKGMALTGAHPCCFQPLDGTPGGDPKDSLSMGRGGTSPGMSDPLIPPPLPMEDLKEALQGQFEHPLWKELSLRCHGCGLCAALCPTCHCFDLVDEPESPTCGVRRRNWDTCQRGRFTAHASGHNPRPEQNHRCRQRLMHKFSNFPLRFDKPMCTGCGRCSRWCPAGMDTLETIRRLADTIQGDTKRKGSSHEINSRITSSSPSASSLPKTTSTKDSP